MLWLAVFIVNRYTTTAVAAIVFMEIIFSLPKLFNQRTFLLDDKLWLFFVVVVASFDRKEFFHLLEYAVADFFSIIYEKRKLFFCVFEEKVN